MKDKGGEQIESERGRRGRGRMKERRLDSHIS